MGLMFARRRAQAVKDIRANKGKAHAQNSARALAAAKAGVHPAEIQKQEAAKAASEVVAEAEKKAAPSVKPGAAK